MSASPDAPTYVVVPSRSRRGPLVTLIEGVLADTRVAKMIVLDNGYDPPLKFPEYGRLLTLRAPGSTVTEMWNEGWSTALYLEPDGPVNVCFLNDDVTVLYGTMQLLANTLRYADGLWAVSPNYERPVSAEYGTPALRWVTGSYREHGLCGWCFMVRGELAREGGPLESGFDEQFRHWGADDDLFYRIAEAGGRLAVDMAIPLDHEGSATATRFDLGATKEADRQRFAAKWGSTWD